MKADPSSKSEGVMNYANPSNPLDQLLQTIETSQSDKSSISLGSSKSSKHSFEGLSLDHLLQNIEPNTSQNSLSQKSHELIHECSNSFIDDLFRGDEDDARDAADVQESLSDASTREESTCLEDEMGGSFASGSASYCTSEEMSHLEKSVQSASCDSRGGSFGGQDLIEGRDEEANRACEQEREEGCVVSLKQLRDEHMHIGDERVISKESEKYSASQSPQPSCDASNSGSPTVEATVTAVLAAVSSNVSTVEERAKWSSVSKATHANDVLVEVEAFTVEPRNLMNRPGLRCPVSLPIPISTIGVNCIGRVIHSSAHAALHDIMFRDRICAIYPFEYEKKRVWNKDGRGYAYVDAGFAISIPKHVDAAEASTLLQIYTPAFQSIQLGITHKDPSNVDRRYTKTLLDDQTILIQHGSTETGLALIELALGLGADQVYATASCVHHSLIEGVGATPLSLVEKKQAKAWELWKTLQDGKISLIIMQEMPSMLELDKFMSVLSDNGSIVFMGDVGNEAEENSPSARNIELKQSDPSDLFDVVEKARIAHEKAALVHRLQTCPEISTYKGVMSNIIDDSLAWKDDVSFLFSLLAQGRIHPRVHERIYSLEDVSKVQDRLELYGKKESVVCLPLKKRFKNSFSKASTRVIIGNCSLRTKVEAHAVTQIASTWRKFACQRAYRCTIEAASRVDTLIYSKREDSATTIQSKWRVCAAKARYRLTISKATALQQFVRGWIACRRLRQLREEKIAREASASTRITAAWRRTWHQRVYSRTIKAIVVCQSIFRLALGVKQLRLLKAKKREEFAKLIQAEWESRIAKRRFNRILLSMRTKKHLEGSAAVVIQAIWRGHFVQQYFTTLGYYATVVETFARKYIASREYNRVIRDVKKCQSVVRQYQAIQMFKAMDYKKKMHLARSKLVKLKCCSIILQTIQYRLGAISIQRAVRGWVGKKWYKKDVKDIVTCQYAVMEFLARKKLIKLRHEAASIILLQALARKSIAARRFAFYRGNVVVIQSVVRMRLTRKRYIATRLAAAVRQRVARVTLTKNRVRKLRIKACMAKASDSLMKIKGCTVILRIIQYRCAALTIQTNVRGWLARTQRQDDLKNIIVCQSVVRRLIVAKNTEGLHSSSEFWRLEAVLSDRPNDTHVTAKSRHLAARTIQTAYMHYNSRNGRRANAVKEHAAKEPPFKAQGRFEPKTLSIDTKIETNEIPSAFSPSSYFSNMARSIQSVFSEYIEGHRVESSGETGRAVEVLEFRLKKEYSAEDEAMPRFINTETEKAEEAALSSQLSPSSYVSEMEDKDLEEFVSAVVVIQNYLYETKEKHNINAAITQIDSFEFDTFYKSILFGVDNPTAALERIVVCQSAARRMIAKRRLHEIREFGNW